MRSGLTAIPACTWVTATEFCRFFAHLRIRITADEMDELMEYLDTDGDGCISFEEFIAVVHANDYLEQTTGYMGVAVPPREAARNLPTKSTTRVMVSEESKAHIRHQGMIPTELSQKTEL